VSGRGERYTLGYGEDERRRLASRRAEDRAGFLLPHLRPGMRLLDVGCGPGSITLGLAAAVAPGRVVGLDLAPVQAEAARAAAADAGAAVDVGVADAYALPFPDGAFDAAFAHTLLFHLREPLAALAEMRRVLRPGGVVGVRDPDAGHDLRLPGSPLLDRFFGLVRRFGEGEGASPSYARHQRRLLLEAGFARTQGFAFAVGDGDPEATRSAAASYAGWFRNPRFVRTVTGNGWADAAELDLLREEVLAWGERPDAFQVRVECAALGWTAP
jgi:ubiquinone/menaquinone biosynthesis C-methylase UbiE